MSVNDDAMTVTEYFAGIGLVRMDLEAAGWQIIFANDFSEKKQVVYLNSTDKSFWAI